MTLHILNLITPLTPTRHSSHSSTVNVRRVDLNSPALRPVLQAIADDASMVLEISDDAPANEDGEEQQIVRDVWIKVSPPVFIRVIPPPSILSQHRSTLSNLSARQSSSSVQRPQNSYAAERRRKTTSEVIESFMSSWTRLVGDPIMSKWIVVLLAISISLNGFLLKGIALGLPVVGRTTNAKGGVRFEEDEDEKKEEKEKEVVKEREVRVREHSSDSSITGVESASTPAPSRPVEPLPIHVPVPKPATSRSPLPTAVPTFTLEDVDRKLKAAASAAASLNTPPLTDSGVHTPPSAEHVRTLEECIDIFENGPRPLSLSMKLLNDEEVILLAQNGKIAMYALEKVLGMDELERAVRIRRALVCKSLRFVFYFFEC